ncbi:unnamed protein product [Chironomus riparius]|uniref:Uncharacterized protein n=1 Tax=Chironomus riparius TaxID=315576 RepID=A0A9N9WX35_9DIPT|nr:unnamed protein product [Chironomus riparius]
MFYVRVLCEVQETNVNATFIQNDFWNCSVSDKPYSSTTCGQYEYLKNIIQDSIFIIIIVTGVIFILCFICVANMIRTKYRRTHEEIFLHNVGPQNVEVATITRIN